jgi:hypothetical protein
MSPALITARRAKAKYVTLLTEGKHCLPSDSSTVQVCRMSAYTYIRGMVVKRFSSVALNAEGLYKGCEWL